MSLSYPRIPYGWANFRAIRLEKRLYVDKTRFLHALEDGEMGDGRREKQSQS